MTRYEQFAIGVLIIGAIVAWFCLPPSRGAK